MDRIGLIVPTWHYFANPFKLQPLIELYLATHIQNKLEDDSVSVIDLRGYRNIEDTKKRHFDNLSDFIVDNVPEQDIYIYWIAKTADFAEIEFITRVLKNKYPNAIHIAGGVHVDNFVEECQSIFSTVIVGPGERSLVQAIKDLGDKKLKRIYRDEWFKVKYQDYPFPRRDFLPDDAIVNTELFEKYGQLLGTSALFSRGCPFKCSYCVYNTPNHLQLKHSQDIEKEIEYLKDRYGLYAVNIRDEVCIGRNKTLFVPYLEAIGRCNIIWRGQTTVGIDQKLLALAKETGCVELVFGIESVCQEVLDGINKKQTIEQCRQSIYDCKECGIKSRINLIFGLPYEPDDIVDKTIDFIEESNPDYVSVSGLCPVPGSDMYKNPGKYGIKYINKNWDKHAHLMFRFSDDEEHGLPFEYDQDSRSEKVFSRKDIIQNILEIQKYLRDKEMCY